MKSNNGNPRATAAGIIAQWLEGNEFPDRSIGPETRDRAFVMEIVFGVVRWKRTLLWVLRHMVDRPPEDSVVPHLLTGLYQILFLDNVADYAAVNETVEIVKARFPRAVTGFVNGVLRRAVRERAALKELIDRQPVAVRLSHPDILIQRWTRRFGEEKTIRLCEWNNGRPHVDVRIDVARVSMPDYRSMLAAAGLEGTLHPFAPDEFVSLAHGVRVADLPGYADGLFGVQDPSTREAVRLLDPKPGHRVLDACAAPGGKTVAVAGRMAGEGEILALDLHADRLETVRENARRMKMAIIHPHVADATHPESLAAVCGDVPFDRILLDVPCTNTGVIRRRPDARWRFTDSRLKRIMQTQRRILDATAPLLKPGGLLVYSTCSLETEEGEDMLGTWLKSNPAFERLEASRLIPPDTGTDGTYAAACCRKE